MAKRKPISKTVRFEVFKRDSFTCQYCGSKAPDVILEVDHINPVANGGDNEIMNLVTSCYSCNRGKSAKLLSDQSIVEKQRKQIEELNIRRQQLEMMLDWRDQNISFMNNQVRDAKYHFEDSCRVLLKKNHEDKIRELIKKFGLVKVLDAIDVACEKYYKTGGADLAFQKIGGILTVQAMPEYRKKISYILGILKNKNFNYNNYIAIELLTDYYDHGYFLEDLITSLKCEKFTSFTQMKSYIVNEIKESNPEYK